MTEKKKPNEINSIFHTLEKQAKSFSLKIRRLKDEGSNTLLGLLLYPPASASADLRHALTNFLNKIPGHIEPIHAEPDLTDFKSFLLKNIEIEQTRTRQTRLPYALVLGEIAVNNKQTFQPQNHAPIIRKGFDTICGETLDVLDFFRFDSGLRFAILMPGANKRIAIRKTESLRKKILKLPIQAKDTKLSLSLTMALSIYTHFDELDAARQLAITTEELDKFKSKGDGIRIVQCPHDDIDGCQVTVAERTELFNLLSTEL